MGVNGLPAYLKEVASTRVSLDDEDGARPKHVVVDGHFALHTAAGIGSVAVPLVLNDNVVPLAMSMATSLNKLASAGWEITVVFDGASPPGKGTTTRSRSAERERARQLCLDLRERKVPLHDQDLQRAAVKAVAFTSHVVARVSRVVSRTLRCECITAPYEADPQLRVLEDMFTRMGKRVLVRGNDSDLMVVGVRSLLWEVTTEEGRLFGNIFTHEGITRPQIHALRVGTTHGHEFLRLLHGVDEGGLGDAVWWSSRPDEVMARLRLWASVSGNDYSKFHGIGKAKATDICLRKKGGQFPTLVEVTESLIGFTGWSEAEVTASLERSLDMTLHPVVFCPETGRQRHLSGCAPTTAVTSNTGVIAKPEVAVGVACGLLCPCALRPWESAFPEQLDSLPSHIPQAPAKRGRRTLTSGETNNFGRTRFSRLPSDAQLGSMTVAQLREFLGPFRCLEQAGTTSFLKSRLLSVAKGIVHVVEQSGLVGSSLVFRMPQQQDAPAGLVQPSDGWLDWEPLRAQLPEFAGDTIIIAWLRARGSLIGDTGRVLYRGMERVLDLGALGWLSGIPCGENGGTLHLRFNSRGSMRDNVYLVQADVRVERVDVVAQHPDVEEGDSDCSDGRSADGSRRRLVATCVEAAWCQCQSGAGGGCHHVCQLLQLVRLLQLTEHELETWDPDSPTSVACQWILRHCGGGRDTEFDIFRGATVRAVVAELRTLRDPKRVPFKGGGDDVPNTRGVVAMDRRTEFSSHPDHGKWASARKHFDDGQSMSHAQWDMLSTFIDGERGPGTGGSTSLAVDVLRPRLRREST